MARYSLWGWGDNLKYFGMYIINTLLLMWLRRKFGNNNSNTDQQPSKYTDSNVNSIGSPIPAVLGRVMIKNPLISYYGDFEAKIYTEEYGAHSKLNVWPAVVAFIISAIAAISSKDTIVVEQSVGKEVPMPSATTIKNPDNITGGDAGGATGGSTGKLPTQTQPSSDTQLFTVPGQAVTTPAGPGATSDFGKVKGKIEYAETGRKRKLLLDAIFNLLMWLLLQLINKHLLKTTIQKGFKYYLGWQNILCWTGKNIGIKRLWMNVYDTKVEQSTQQGVWGSDNISWKSSNPTGIVAHINDDQMFGGPDEGGGFVGDVRLYFGTTEQSKDSWMVKQMSESESIPKELKGLTPIYPMYFTSVIPKAYIGKQATIPEMWFEIVNYPSGLHDTFKYDLQGIYDSDMLDYIDDMLSFIGKQPYQVQEHLKPYTDDVRKISDKYKKASKVSNIKRQSLDEARDVLVDAKAEYDAHPSQSNAERLKDAQSSYDDAEAAYNKAQKIADDEFAKTKEAINALYDNYPPSEKDEFGDRIKPLRNLLDNGLWHLGRLGDDVNPAEAIYEILTNSDWGCDYSISRIDILSLLNMGVTLEEEGLGVSCLINKTTTAGQVIHKILNHVNGVCYDDPKTGKLTFKLVRNDYDVDTIPKFSPHNCNSLEFTRLDWSETTNAVTASFTYADDKYNTSTLMVSDVANVKITKNYTETQVDAEYFTTAENARTFANQQLLSSAYPLSAINIQCNRIAYDLTIGDPILINWLPYGIEKQVFRVTDIDYASLTSGMIKITAVEDVFGFDKIDYEFGEIPKWNDPAYPPEDIVNELFMEMPYEFTRGLDTYVYAFAPQTKSVNSYWHLWRYISSKYQDVAQSSTFSTVLSMTYGCEELFGLDVGFECEVFDEYSRAQMERKRQLIEENPDTYTNKSALNLICIDDEIMSYRSIELLMNGNYKFTDVVRGIFDTLPKKHTSGSVVHLLDYGMSISGTIPCAYQGYISEEQLEVTSQTLADAQEFDVNKITHLTTTRRAEQPTVMANMQFGANRGTLTEYKYNWPATTQFSHDILFKFNGRNKFQNYGILMQTDNTTPTQVSADIKNVITLESNNVNMEFTSDAFDSVKNTNSVGDTLKWSDFCKKMDVRLMETNDVHMQVRTLDTITNLYSHAEYVKDLYYVTPRLGGIVESEKDVQSYADSIVQSTIIFIPETTFSPSLTMSYEDCVLIFVGIIYPADPTDTSLVRGQTTQWYHLPNYAYRVDGCEPQLDAEGKPVVDDNGEPKLKAIIHKIDIENEFVFRTNFTLRDGNYTAGYKLRTGVWIPWTFYK